MLFRSQTSECQALYIMLLAESHARLICIYWVDQQESSILNRVWIFRDVPSGFAISRSMYKRIGSFSSSEEENN